MDAPFHNSTPICGCDRSPISPWIPVVVILAILGLAGLASACVTDTRDFAAKHATVIPERLL